MRPKYGPWIEPELLNGWTTPKGFSPPACRLAWDGESLQWRGNAVDGDYAKPILRLPDELERFFGTDTSWSMSWDGRVERFVVDDDGYLSLEISE